VREKEDGVGFIHVYVCMRVFEVVGVRGNGKRWCLMYVPARPAAIRS